MKKVHLVIADLFLPCDFAADVCADLQLPALEKILARGRGGSKQAVSLEGALCSLFGAHAVAPVSASYDGLEAGSWLRADPVHVRLQREQVVLLPVSVRRDEATALCASLNAHFQDMEFFAPHPERWYVRMKQLPDISTVPISQAMGRNIHGNLPVGAQAGSWHQLFNEIQMLLFAHPLNEVRESRGEVPVNSVWFWGEGKEGVLRSEYASVSSDDVLVQMLSASSSVPFKGWEGAWSGAQGDQLLVWTGLRGSLQCGDLAAWRSALQQFEINYAQPLWRALRKGHIAQLQLDILGGGSLQRVSLARGDAWAFWRRTKKLSDYSAESAQG